MEKVLKFLLCGCLALALNNCRTLNTMQKLTPECFSYRGMTISPDENKLYRSGDDAYIEVDIQECENHAYWIRRFSISIAGGEGNVYRIKEDSEEPHEKKYLRFCWKDLDNCKYPYVAPGVSYDFYSYPYTVDRSKLLDESHIEQCGAQLAEWPEAWKNIKPDDKKNLYIVDKEQAWYWPIFLPSAMALHIGVDFPSGIFFVLWDEVIAP